MRQIECSFSTFRRPRADLKGQESAEDFRQQALTEEAVLPSRHARRYLLQGRIAGLLLWLICLPTSAATQAELPLDRYGAEAGLAQASVNAVLRDRRGFVWVGTQEGLHRFDGHGFKLYRRDGGREDSLPDNFVLDLAEDRDDQLWVATYAGGVARFDPATGKWQRFSHHPEMEASISHNWVRALALADNGDLYAATAFGLDRIRYRSGRVERLRPRGAERDVAAFEGLREVHVADDGRLWIGTDAGGLFVYQPETSHLQGFRHEPENPESLPSNSVYSIVAAADGELWVGTDGGGVGRFSPATGRFHALQPRSGQPMPERAAVMALMVDANGRLWIATRGAGLGLYQPASDHLRWLQHDPSDVRGLGHNSIWALVEDADRDVWIGSADGLHRYDPRRQQFAHFRHRPRDPESLSHDWVRGFSEDRAGRLWVATHRGLNLWEPVHQRFAHFFPSQGDPARVASDHVRSILADSDVLWAGTDTGLFRFDLATREFAPVPLPDPRGIDRVAVVYADPAVADRLWLGTLSSGLVWLDTGSGNGRRFRQSRSVLDGLPHNDVRSVLRDRRGRFWVGTWGGGLCRLHEPEFRFECFRHDPLQPESLANDGVRHIHEDADGMLWLATLGGGLVRFDPDSGRSRAYTRQDGLPDDSLYGILEDAEGHLWISSNSGLFRFDPASAAVLGFRSRDGLQHDEFNTNAFLKRADGELLFGGIRGFNRFYPERIVQQHTPPRVVLTELLLFNRPIAPGVPVDGFVLERPIDRLDQLTLSHRESQFSVEFAALQFSDPARLRYAYRLDGYDNDWIETDAINRRATYTSLPAGDYLLRVRAAVGSAPWAEGEASLPIRVLPPPWLSPWAYFSYVSLVAFGIVFVFRQRTAAMRRQATRLQHEVAERTTDLVASRDRLSESMRQLEAAHRQLIEAQQQLVVREKMAALGTLTAGVAHEINNPTNFASGAVQQLAEDLRRLQEFIVELAGEDASGEVLAAFRRRFESLHALTETAQEGHRRIAQIVGDLRQFTRLDEAERKPIRLSEPIQSTLNLVRTRFDRIVFEVDIGLDAEVECQPAKLGQVFMNLIVNACEAVRDFRGDAGGWVRVAIALESGFAVVHIDDNGGGMPEPVRQRIFEPFFTTKPVGQGTGLGLAITLGIVREHGGDMEVTAVEGEGSRFVVRFPCRTGG